MDLITLHVALIYMLLPFITFTDSAPIRYKNHYNTKMVNIDTNNEETRINIDIDEKVGQESEATTNGKLREQLKTRQKTNVQEMKKSCLHTALGQLNAEKVAKDDVLSEFIKTVGTVLPSNDEESSKTYFVMLDEGGKLKKNNIKKSMKKPKKSSKVTHAVYQKDQK